jgi:predicted GNAT family acetyltransferase
LETIGSPYGTILALRAKLKVGAEMAGEFDPVEEASEESFPASDSPAWAMGGESRSAGVSNNSARHRFEASIEENTAFLDYHLAPPTLTLIHTEVPAAMRGHAVGSTLARAALEFARREGLHVKPLCSFVAAYIRRHPEYMDLVQGPDQA